YHRRQSFPTRRSSDLFPGVRFLLENGKQFVIKANGVSAKNIYIQSATLHGRPRAIPFLAHRDLMAGGQLVFEMGSRPSQWGRSRSEEHTSELQSLRHL